MTDFHLVIPAAGVGRRFGGECPKQYQRLLGLPIIHHAIGACAASDRCVSVTVALSAEDEFWGKCANQLETMPPLFRVAGGAERCDSVLAALDALAERGVADDALVLVHDAARPYVPAPDLEALLEVAPASASGAILAAPVADTIKRVAESGGVVETVDRSNLWRALTPQACRLGILREALRKGVEAGLAITDEASALEAAGFSPKVVLGSAANIKVTIPSDLTLVAALMAAN